MIGLTWFTVSYNQLSGTLPGWLGSLSRFESVVVAGDTGGVDLELPLIDGLCGQVSRRQREPFERHDPGVTGVADCTDVSGGGLQLFAQAERVGLSEMRDAFVPQVNGLDRQPAEWPDALGPGNADEVEVSTTPCGARHSPVHCA